MITFRPQSIDYKKKLKIMQLLCLFNLICDERDAIITMSFRCVHFFCIFIFCDSLNKISSFSLEIFIYFFRSKQMKEKRNTQKKLLQAAKRKMRLKMKIKRFSLLLIFVHFNVLKNLFDSSRCNYKKKCITLMTVAYAQFRGADANSYIRNKM